MYYGEHDLVSLAFLNHWDSESHLLDLKCQFAMNESTLLSHLMLNKTLLSISLFRNLFQGILELDNTQLFGIWDFRTLKTLRFAQTKFLSVSKGSKAQTRGIQSLGYSPSFLRLRLSLRLRLLSGTYLLPHNFIARDVRGLLSSV